MAQHSDSMSCPFFLSSIGDPASEIKLTGPMTDGFPIMPLLDHHAHPNPRLPNDNNRSTVAHLLADVSLRFLIHHEIGHIVGGHLELIGGSAPLLEIQDEFVLSDSALRHTLECDADAFAGHATRALHVHAELEEDLAKIIPADKMSPIEKSHLTLLTSISVLFRLMHCGVTKPSPPTVARTRTLCAQR